MKLLLLFLFWLAEYYLASQYRLTLLLLITIFQAILLLPLFLYPRLLKRRIKLQPRAEETVAAPASELGLLVSNASFWPATDLTLRLAARQGAGKQRWQLRTSVPARGSREVKLALKNLRPGRLTLTYEKVTLHDPGRFFSSSRKLNLPQVLYVMPEYRPVYAGSQSLAAGEQALAAAGGRGLEEVKQLRGYQPGDRLRDVHWPSSARFGQLYVKEYEGQPSRPLLRLRLDFTHEAGDDLTAYYELVYGLVLASLESGREVELADTDELVLKPAVISQREDLDQAMKRLYDAPAISESAGGDLVLATDLTLRRGGKIIREFRKGDGGEIQI